jgi:hypothetical protein
MVAGPHETERRLLGSRALFAATVTIQRHRGSKNGKNISKHGKD